MKGHFMTHSKSKSHPYRVAVTWGALVAGNSAIDTSAALAPTSPGSRNSIGVKFTGFSVGLGSVNASLRQSAISSYVVPVTLPATPPLDIDGSKLGVTFFGFKNILRGFISKHKDARAVIVLNVGGTSQMIEFPFGVEIQIGADAQISSDFNLSSFAVQQIEPVGNPASYPSQPSFGGDIILLVERRNPNADVLLEIDELDVTAAFSSPDGPVP